MLQMRIQPEKWRTRKKGTGESVFAETDPISLFSDLVIYLLLHIETNGNFTFGNVLNVHHVKLMVFQQPVLLGSSPGRSRVI